MVKGSSHILRQSVAIRDKDERGDAPAAAPSRLFEPKINNLVNGPVGGRRAVNCGEGEARCRGRNQSATFRPAQVLGAVLN